MLEDSAPIAFPPNFRMSEQCPEWKALLTELLAAIAKRLTSIDDYASFRSVCTSWRAAATFHNFDTEFPRVLRLVYFSGKFEETPIPLGDYLAGKREETPILLGDSLAGKREETLIDYLAWEREETLIEYLAWEREETPILGDALVWKSDETPVLGDDLYEKSEETPILLGDSLAGKTEETSIFGDDLFWKSDETPVLGDDLYESDETPVLGDDLYESDETPVLGDALVGETDETPVHVNIVANLLDLESNTCKSTNFPPVPDDYKCNYVSCSGWILVGDEPQLSLKHFMLGINIKLPGLGSFITKMVLSGSPIEAEADLLVMVIYSCDDQLAFCRPGDESWTEMDWSESCFYDIIYHNKKLYALDHGLRIVECDIHGSNPTKIVQVFDFPPNVDETMFRLIVHKYLVESFGKFLIVVRYESESENESHYFRVFEIELNDGSCKEIHNLGNRCLFLGLNSSICVDFSASSRVKLNCIYSAEKKRYTGLADVGVYTLCDGRFEDFSGMFDRIAPPLWVVPSI